MTRGKTPNGAAGNNAFRAAINESVDAISLGYLKRPATPVGRVNTVSTQKTEAAAGKLTRCVFDRKLLLQTFAEDFENVSIRFDGSKIAEGKTYSEFGNFAEKRDGASTWNYLALRCAGSVCDQCIFACSYLFSAIGGTTEVFDPTTCDHFALSAKNT